MPTVGFDEVNISPVAGSKMGVKYLLGSTSAYPVQDIGGIWPGGQTYSHAVFAKQFDGGDLSGVAPANALFAYAINNGVSSDVVAALTVAHAMRDHSTVFGANLIAMSHPGVHHAKLVGLEVDVEPSDGNIVGAGSGGIYLNAFNEPIPGAAMQIGSVGGGSFQNGIIIDGVQGAGVAPGSGSVMASALNTSAGSYTESAVVLGNQHGIKMNNASGQPVVVMTDTGGNFRVFGNTGFIFQKNSMVEGAELFSARDASGVEAISAKIARGSPSSTSACALRVNGQSATGRSINAGGTINSNGADYAEYERIKDGSPAISKGQVIGFDVNGEITTRFDEAVSFGVKTTNPSFVGGDAWSRVIGEPPAPPEYPQSDITRPTEPEYRKLRPDQREKAAGIYRAAMMVYEAEVNADYREWEETTFASYQLELAEYEDVLEIERQKWDRIAYCGKVPANVYAAAPGDWIIPTATDDGGIAAVPMRMKPSEAMDALTVGRVIRILEDGRAEISVLKL